MKISSPERVQPIISGLKKLLKLPSSQPDVPHMAPAIT
jgi:hypothetical protein